MKALRNASEKLFVLFNNHLLEDLKHEIPFHLATQ